MPIWEDEEAPAAAAPQSITHRVRAGNALPIQFCLACLKNHIHREARTTGGRHGMRSGSITPARHPSHTGSGYPPGLRNGAVSAPEGACTGEAAHRQ
jgi:hypothetical protein